LFGSCKGAVWWREWFRNWTHVRTIAFICEDTWWRTSAETAVSTAAEAAENIVRQWLVDSPSLQRFEMWSGATAIQLSLQFRVAHARFHTFSKYGCTRNRYLFGHDETTRTWTLLPSTTPMCSAVSRFHETACTTGCWICHAIASVENLEDLDCIILCWQEISQEVWYDRSTASGSWSELDNSYTYRLSN